MQWNSVSYPINIWRVTGGKGYHNAGICYGMQGVWYGNGVWYAKVYCVLLHYITTFLFWVICRWRLMSFSFCKLLYLLLIPYFLIYSLISSSPLERMTFCYVLLCRATEVSWIVNDTAEEEVPACSLRHIIKKENSLKKHFSFLVPVLQWRDSFIHSHWEKLQNEPLPYGWKNQSYHGKPSLQSLKAAQTWKYKKNVKNIKVSLFSRNRQDSFSAFTSWKQSSVWAENARWMCALCRGG